VVVGVRWRGLRSNQWCETDAEGRFAARAHVSGIGSVVLTLSDGWALERDDVVGVGAQGVMLRAFRTCVLSGSVVVRSTPFDDLEVCVRGTGLMNSSIEVPGATRTLKSDEELTFPARERFVVRGLRPGRYSVVVRRVGTNSVLARSDDRDVTPPSAVLPPLLVDD